MKCSSQALRRQIVLPDCLEQSTFLVLIGVFIAMIYSGRVRAAPFLQCLIALVFLCSAPLGVVFLLSLLSKASVHSREGLSY